jgi:hypothetical protein
MATGGWATDLHVRGEMLGLGLVTRASAVVLSVEADMPAAQTGRTRDLAIALCRDREHSLCCEATGYRSAPCGVFCGRRHRQ